jgi:hypothetical protein
MAEARVTNPLIEQFRQGGVPKELRLMAAQGALPLKSEDLLELLTDLVRDSEAPVREAAQASLIGFPGPELLPLLRHRDTPPAVLAWVVASRPERELREVALQNTSLADEAIEALAPSLSTDLAELVVINQVRLLRRTSLLEALETNPGLSNDQKRRLRELRETFKIGVQTAPAPPPPPPAPEPPPAAPVEEMSLAAPTMTEAEALAAYLGADERHEPEKISAVQKIFRMNAAEKVIAALKGTRSDRALLVRDPNRMVWSAVLGSPSLTDAEIESFSAMRNISDQALRRIGGDREWTKKYIIISNLVKNPRTPIGVSMTLVSRLTPRDLKAVVVDKNVPEAVRKHAEKFVRGPGGGGGGKH